MGFNSQLADQQFSPVEIVITVETRKELEFLGQINYRNYLLLPEEIKILLRGVAKEAWEKFDNLPK